VENVFESEFAVELTHLAWDSITENAEGSIHSPEGTDCPGPSPDFVLNIDVAAEIVEISATYVHTGSVVEERHGIDVGGSKDRKLRNCGKRLCGS
jgi:hypothetical protein